MSRLRNCAELILISGLVLHDGDILDVLHSILRHQGVLPPTLLITDILDHRTANAILMLPILGVFNPHQDGKAQLRDAVLAVAQGREYWSAASRAEFLEQFSKKCYRLTPTEQLVLSTLGDGSDDEAASKILGMRPSTILSVRRELHRKLGIHSQGNLVRKASQLGYVR
ncbi:MAG: DNA-binding response regulator, partial [Methylocystaceae bacterium]|nr:DNA-binding response regulator [Methylocystaceae bacterium]